MPFDASKITFFDFLTPLVASGQKTITIRDEKEKDYVVGSVVEVFTLETQQKVCSIKILSIEQIHFSEINAFHAQQEALELEVLKDLIKDVYPNQETLFVITFELASVE